MTAMDFAPDFATATDPFLAAAFYLGIGVTGLTLLFLCQIVVWSVLKLKREERTRRFMEVWHPILADVIDGGPKEKLPKIKKRDHLNFLLLWNHYHHTLKGSPTDELNILIRKLGLNITALRLLRKKRIRIRLTAIIAVGNLQDAAAWQELSRMVSCEDGCLSFAAAQSLVRISARRAIPLLMPIIISHEDWPPPKVAVLLKEAGTDLVSEPLARAALEAPLARQPKMIRYLEVARYEISAPVIRQIIEESSDKEVLSACLHVAKDPLLLDRIRELTSHETWSVRAIAATALGRIGSEDDIPKLMTLLSDRVWWVRNRAAEAIGSLPCITLMELKKIKIAVNDRFGKEMMGEIIAEKEALRWN